LVYYCYLVQLHHVTTCHSELKSLKDGETG